MAATSPARAAGVIPAGAGSGVFCMQFREGNSTTGWCDESSEAMGHVGQLRPAILLPPSRNFHDTRCSMTTPNAPTGAVVASAPLPATPALSTWSSVLGYADSHPQVASALIGAGGSLLVGVITLTGVALTLVHAHHRMKRELQAQRDRANEERAYSANQATQKRLAEMRQDLYLKIIEQYQSAIAVIAGLPSIKPDHLPKAIAELNNLHASVQMTSLMSETATSDAAVEAHSRLNELMFSLMHLLPEIHTHENAIDEADAAINRLQSIIDDARERSREINPKAFISVADNAYRQVVSASLSEQRGAHNRKVAAIKRRGELTDEFQSKMLHGLRHAREAAVNFFALAKQELGMTPDPDALRQRAANTFDRAISALSSMRTAVGAADLPIVGTGNPQQGPEPDTSSA